MKTAIYIEDGVQQIVLTAENDFEKNIIESLTKSENEVDIFEGSFYDCRGGWVRQSNYFKGSHLSSSANDKSLIIKRKETQ